MFVRVKKVGTYQYLQIAENRREGKRVKQTIIATLGRLDKLTASGAVDQLLRSAARFWSHSRSVSQIGLSCLFCLRCPQIVRWPPRPTATALPMCVSCSNVR